MRKIILGILVMAMMAGCVSLDCPVENLVCSIYQLQKTDGSADTMRVDTMWVWTQRIDDSDTLLINRLCGSNATKFSIPMSYTLPLDQICTRVVDTCKATPQHEWMDTIRLSKIDQQHFEGVDCKPNYFHTLTGVTSTHHLIDTVIINKTDVSYDTSTPHLLLRLKARR